MSDTGAARETPDTFTAPRGRRMNITLWVLQAFLAISFVSASVLKLSGDQDMVDMFDDIGAGQWLRYVIGLIEIAGAIGVLIPLLSGLAALGLTALMVGAAITNPFIDMNPLTPIGLLVLAALVAWGRWPRTRALAGRFGH